MSWFNSNFCFGGRGLGCLATWALWALTGMTAGYPVGKDDVSSGGSHLGTLAICYR